MECRTVAQRQPVNPIALAVKLADIEDNTAPERTARLEPEVRQRLAAKYENARKLLGQK